MVGRTNALIGALVSSVNGMTGAVILNANIAYDPTIEYDENTIGDTLKQGGGGGGAVQSVNGMTGDVVLNANIAYNPETTYDEGTIGNALQDTVTREDLDDIRELPETSSAENGKVLAVVDGEWAAAEIPEGNLPPVTSADNGKVLGVVEGEWAVKDDEGGSLPDVTSADNGKVLGVVDGEWEKTAIPSGNLPPVTSADNGKVLGVVEGEWDVMEGGGGAVSSVNGQTGAVVIDAGIEFNTEETYPEDSVGNAIGEIYNSVISEQELEYGAWSQGSIRDTDGTELTSTNTCRSGFVAPTALPVTATIKAGWKIKFAFYASPSSFSIYTGYKEGTYKLPLNDTDNKVFRMCVRNTDTTDIVPGDIPDDVVTLSYPLNKIDSYDEKIQSVEDAYNDTLLVDEVICGGLYNQGTLSDADGSNVTSTKHIRTGTIYPEYIASYPSVHIEPASGYIISLYVFNYDATTDTYPFSFSIHDIAEPYDYEQTGWTRFRVVVQKADDSTISPYTASTQNLFTITAKRCKAELTAFDTEYEAKNEQFVPIVRASNPRKYHSLNVISGNGYINPSTGEAEVFSTANKLSTTAMIDISAFGVLYYKRATYSNNPGGMAFYDSNGTYISGEPALKGSEGYAKETISDIEYIVLGVVNVPKNAVYARFTILTGSSNGTFELYGTYRLANEYNNSKFGVMTRRNDPTKVEEFLTIAKTYLPTGNQYLPAGHSGQDTLGYGYGTILSSAQPLQTVAGKWDIDCSTFVGLALRGYTYEETSYPTENWVDPSTWVAKPGIEWAIDPFDWTEPFYGDWIREPEDTRRYSRIRTASQMCQWMVERGWEVPIDSGLANLEPGDIIFYSRHDASSNDYIDPDRYKLINHVAICMTKEAPLTTEGYQDRFHYSHKLIDVRTRTGACGTDTVESQWNNPSAITTNNVNTIICICRPDLG